MFIDPVAFRIGPIAVHWYGIIFAVAAVAAAWVATREARRRGEDSERVWTLLLVAAIGGIIGSRLYHVIHEWAFYSENPALIPQVWLGGLGIPGGVAGGMIALAIYTRVQGLKLWRWLDIAAPAMLLAQAIGRFGNLVNQELYGPPTTLPWGIPIDAEHRGAAVAPTSTSTRWSRRPSTRCSCTSRSSTCSACSSCCTSAAGSPGGCMTGISRCSTSSGTARSGPCSRGSGPATG